VVVLRRDREGRRVCREIATLPLKKRDEVLRMARLHLDASRSAALFAERLLLVEGVTEAAVVREFGWVWAADDVDKQAFVDAMSIVPMGTKVGPWPVRLLATRDYELCRRLAVLRDSDVDFASAPSAPSWASDHDEDVLLVEHCHPTLEPQLTVGNEALIAAALAEVGLPVPEPVNAEAVHAIFRGAHKDGDNTMAAGPGARHKGEFALALAGQVRDARKAGGTDIWVPDPLRKVFDFLFASLQSSAPAESTAPTSTPVHPATPEKPVESVAPAPGGTG
jgi:putative ATP-dependent endonuclease of OLD family